MRRGRHFSVSAGSDMAPMRDEIFVREMARLCIAFQRQPDQLLYAVYRDGLYGFTDRNMTAAVDHAIRRERFFPPVSVLRTLGFGGGAHGMPAPPRVLDVRTRQLPPVDREDDEAERSAVLPGVRSRAEHARQIIRDLAQRQRERHATAPAGDDEIFRGQYDTPEALAQRKAELAEQARKARERDDLDF